MGEWGWRVQGFTGFEIWSSEILFIYLFLGVELFYWLIFFLSSSLYVWIAGLRSSGIIVCWAGGSSSHCRRAPQVGVFPTLLLCCVWERDKGPKRKKHLCFKCDCD
jgi:hypothetical protein